MPAKRRMFVRTKIPRRVKAPEGYMLLWAFVEPISVECNLAKSTVVGILDRAIKQGKFKHFIKAGRKIFIAKNATNDALGIIAMHKNYSPGKLEALGGIKKKLRAAGADLLEIDSNKEPREWKAAKELVDSLGAKMFELQNALDKESRRAKIRREG
ncbi:MAG: hypothetical protein J4415_02300 [Candidatus Diapherotrites archaeon]|uniref:Uncharacterized protein n=1 Tax=Candidatus Iainarchaeum sp. TaxID=3101447 RepID=A0A8T4L2Y5_9ARCH|nr:hypothetical protein [Candidatus Diapherotrites archaeon]